MSHSSIKRVYKWLYRLNVRVGWRGGAMVGRRTCDQEVASSIHGRERLRNESGQVVHTQLPLRWHSSLVYRVVKLGTFTIFTFAFAKHELHASLQRRARGWDFSPVSIHPRRLHTHPHPSRTDSDPFPPIPANSSIHPHQPPHIFCQPKAVITVTIVAILKIPHSAAVSILVSALVIRSLYYVVPVVIKSIPVGIPHCQIHPRGITATFIPTPAGIPRIPLTHPRAHLYFIADWPLSISFREWQTDDPAVNFETDYNSNGNKRQWNRI